MGCHRINIKSIFIKSLLAWLGGLFYADEFDVIISAAIRSQVITGHSSSNYRLLIISLGLHYFKKRACSSNGSLGATAQLMISFYGIEGWLTIMCYIWFDYYSVRLCSNLTDHSCSP